MQLTLKINIDEPLELPINYHHLLQAIIYNNLKNHLDFSGFLHDEGYSYGNRVFKLFTFSLLKGKYEIKNKKIYFKDQILWKVSSPENQMIRTLAENIRNKGIWFGNRHIEKAEVYTFDRTIERNTVFIRMLSPICVYATDRETGFTQYGSPFEDGFSEMLVKNFIRKYYSYYGIYPQSVIQIEPVKVSDRDKYVTNYQGGYISGWMGIYKLSGERKYIDFLYQTGLGGKNSQGFGMWEVISEKCLRREEDKNGK